MRSEPQNARTLVWALPVSLAATPGIDVSFSSSGYLDVSVHRVPLHTLWIGVWILEVCSSGFPHSDTSGSMDICSSPKLFAAYHVFHRLLVPRHPPCALFRLTSHIYSVICAGGFSLFSSLLLLLLSFIVLGFPSLSSDVLLINNELSPALANKFARSWYSSNTPSRCHPQPPVRKRPSPVPAICPAILFIYRIFFLCMRFSRYVVN